MKVLALTVLILVIGSLEAGVVKREIPNAEEVGQLLQFFFNVFKNGAQDLAEKLQNERVQAQLLERAKVQTDTFKVEIEKVIAKIVEAGKNLAA